MIDFGALLRALTDGQVEYVIVGGVAAAIHGGARATYDLDVVYRRTPENIGRVVDALAPYHPFLRGAPPGLPFEWDAATVARGLNFTLITSLGDVDLLGEIVGGGSYEMLLPHSFTVSVVGIQSRCLTLEKLIAVKRATGRQKDFDALAELEAIAEETSRPEGQS
jgi:hypothetical protein